MRTEWGNFVTHSKDMRVLTSTMGQLISNPVNKQSLFSKYLNMAMKFFRTEACRLEFSLRLLSQTEIIPRNPCFAAFVTSRLYTGTSQTKPCRLLIQFHVGLLIAIWEN